jgi:hypothetical protein
MKQTTTTFFSIQKRYVSRCRLAYDITERPLTLFVFEQITYFPETMMIHRATAAMEKSSVINPYAYFGTVQVLSFFVHSTNFQLTLGAQGSLACGLEDFLWRM